MDRCKEWLAQLLSRRTRVIVPEIADDEIRRELIRAGKTQGIGRLDALESVLEYLPLNTTALRKAAVLWAEIRKQGRPTADPHALDGDVILAAQALTAGIDKERVAVATTNVGHLARLLPAFPWDKIS